MNILSEILSYHESGEGPDETTLEQYGEPARTLFTALDPGDLHQRIDIIDEQEQVLYQTKSSVFTLFGKTDITGTDGRPVAHIEKQPVSLHEKHFITMADGRQITLSNELFHVVRDITNIEGLGWQLRGNVIGLKFTLFDENSTPVAVIGQKPVSLHNRFSIDIYQPQHEQAVVAIVTALQKMLTARRENEQ